LKFVPLIELYVLL